MKNENILGKLMFILLNTRSYNLCFLRGLHCFVIDFSVTKYITGVEEGIDRLFYYTRFNKT